MTEAPLKTYLNGSHNRKLTGWICLDIAGSLGSPPVVGSCWIGQLFPTQIHRNGILSYVFMVDVYRFSCADKYTSAMDLVGFPKFFQCFFIICFFEICKFWITEHTRNTRIKWMNSWVWAKKAMAVVEGLEFTVETSMEQQVVLVTHGTLV